MRPLYEQAVSNLDRSMRRSLWVYVAHRLFIEGSHMTKNAASANFRIGSFCLLKKYLFTFSELPSISSLLYYIKLCFSIATLLFAKWQADKTSWHHLQHPLLGQKIIFQLWLQQLFSKCSNDSHSSKIVPLKTPTLSVRGERRHQFKMFLVWRAFSSKCF